MVFTSGTGRAPLRTKQDRGKGGTNIPHYCSKYSSRNCLKYVVSANDENKAGNSQ